MNTKTYYAHITHDGLTEGADTETQKYMVYLTQASNAGFAEDHFKSLEIQFQGKNFKILTWGLLIIRHGIPLFMGVNTTKD